MNVRGRWYGGRQSRETGSRTASGVGVVSAKSGSVGKSSRGLLRAFRRFVEVSKSSELPLVMTYRRAAKELGVSERRVRQLVRLNRLRAVRINGRKKITRAALSRALL